MENPRTLLKWYADAFVAYANGETAEELTDLERNGLHEDIMLAIDDLTDNAQQVAQHIYELDSVDISL